MQERRYDNKGRLLHTGEVQMSDGRYRYKYKDVDGKMKVIYSLRLCQKDRAPRGKKKVFHFVRWKKRFNLK